MYMWRHLTVNNGTFPDAERARLVSAPDAERAILPHFDINNPSVALKQKS